MGAVVLAPDDEPELPPYVGESSGALTISEMVRPLTKLEAPVSPEEIKQAVQAVVKNFGDGADRMDVELAKGETLDAIRKFGYSAVVARGLLKAAIAAARSSNSASGLPGQAIVAPEPDAWPKPVDGAALLTAMRDVFLRYSVLVPHAAEALALNALRTHVMEAFDFNPILAVMSPTKRCGKTRVLEVSALLVARPLLVSKTSPAGVYRAIEQAHPTLFLDEADTYSNLKDDYRGILNSCHHRPSAWVEVQVPTATGEWVPRKFSTYSPLFLGFIGTIPDTNFDRSVVVPMRRRKPTEVVERFDEPQRAALLPIKRQAIRWSLDNQAALRDAVPTVPEGLNDRQEDCWRPLLAIAELAGGAWPKWARDAAAALSKDQHEEPTIDLYLLDALRGVFGAAKQLPSSVLLARLNQDLDAPWHGGLSSHELGKHLRGYGVRSKTLYWKGSEWLAEEWGVYPEGGKAKGYARLGLEDAWARYLSPVGTEGETTSEAA